MSSDAKPSDAAQDHFCNPCHEVKGQLVTTLFGYCTVCENFLCISCKEMHDHFPATRNHKIVAGEELPKLHKSKITINPTKLDETSSKQIQTGSTVPEIKPKGSLAQKSLSTAPEHLKCDDNKLDEVTESLSKANIAYLDSSVPESATLLDKLDIRFSKLGSFNAKIKDDKKECWITGIALTKVGKILIADNLNEKLKVFSKDMKCLSSLSLSGEPWDVALFSDSEAVVSMPENEQLLIVDISANKPRIKQTLDLKYRVYGVAVCQDSLIVACPYTSPPSLKRIDRRGRVKWSVDSHNGQQLFTRPWYVLVNPTPASSAKGSGSSIVVTDCDFHLVNPRLVLLDSSTGKVIGCRKMEGKNPYGITVDETRSEYIYMCNSVNEVVIMTQDLTEERLVLTQQDGVIETPQALAFNALQHTLIVSYSNKNRSRLDYFQCR